MKNHKYKFAVEKDEWLQYYFPYFQYKNWYVYVIYIYIFIGYLIHLPLNYLNDSHQFSAILYTDSTQFFREYNFHNLKDHVNDIEYPILIIFLYVGLSYISYHIPIDINRMFIYHVLFILIISIAFYFSIVIIKRLYERYPIIYTRLIFLPIFIFLNYINLEGVMVLLILLSFYFLFKEKYYKSVIITAIGTLFKMISLFIFIAMLIQAIRDRSYMYALKITSLYIGIVVGVYGLAFLFMPKAISYFFTMNASRNKDLGSIYYGLYTLFDWNISNINIVMIFLYLITYSLIIFLIYKFQFNIVESSTILICNFFLFNKVISPQYWIIIYVLIAILLTYRDCIIVNLVSIIYSFSAFSYINRGISAHLYGALTLLNASVILFYILYIIYKVLYRSSDFLILKPLTQRSNHSMIS